MCMHTSSFWCELELDTRLQAAVRTDCKSDQTHDASHYHPDLVTGVKASRCCPHVTGQPPRSAASCCTDTWQGVLLTITSTGRHAPAMKARWSGPSPPMAAWSLRQWQAPDMPPGDHQLEQRRPTGSGAHDQLGLAAVGDAVGLQQRRRCLWQWRLAQQPTRTGLRAGGTAGPAGRALQRLDGSLRLVQVLL